MVIWEFTTDCMTEINRLKNLKFSLRLNPESSLKILESISASEIQPNEPLYNVTHTLVCNDLYKLGYEKCK